MVGKRQHQQGEEEERAEEMFEPVLEFKARDGAWYAGTAAFVGPLLRVHFEHFSEEEDERWQPEKFGSLKDVKKMIRPASQPMQDFHCKELRRGVILCVACRHSNSDCFEYYDAKLQQLNRFPHEFLADNQECCRCQFEVEWRGGPLRHRRQFVSCGDICILTPGDIEDDPAIKEFVGIVKSLKAGKTASKLAGSEASLERNASWTSKKSRTQHSACSEENEQKRLKTSPGCRESSSQTGGFAPKDGENPEGSHWRKDASEMNACHYNTKAATKSSEPPYSGSLPDLNEWARELSVRNHSLEKKDSANVFPSRGGLPDLNDSAKQSSCSEAGRFSTYPAFVGGAQRFSREEDMEDSSSYECLTLRDSCDQESSLHGISQKRKTGTTTNEGKSTNAPRTDGNLANSKCDLRSKSDGRLNNLQVPCAVNTDLQHTVLDLKDKYKIPHFVALGDSSKVSPSKQKDIINLDSDEEEDLPLISRMKCQVGSLKEAFPTQMTPTFDVDSHHRKLNGKEPDTLPKQSIPNYIPVEADLANQAVACKSRTDPVMVSSNKTMPDAKLGSRKSDYNTSMQSEPLPRETPASSMEKPTDPVIGNRLHAMSSMPNKASQQHTSILEEKTPPETKSKQQWSLQSPLVDESSNNDFSGLSKEQAFSQSCMGHISLCSCTAFQSSCYKSRSCHECGAMGVISIPPLHLQTSMCGYASSCLCEGHSGCRHNSFNFTRKSGHYCTAPVCSQGGSKILHSQDAHTMQSQGCEEDEDIKEKPKTDGASRKEMLPEDVKVMSPSQFLFIENLEKDITPFKALKIILKVSPGALMVYIWPSLEYETTTKGYICYQDSQAADTAYSNFHAGKFMIISTKGRPWVVSRSQAHILNWNQLYSISAAATIKWEENKEASMEDVRDANGGLLILFKGTEEYTMALGKQKLFLEQKKELRLCYLRFSNEERELEALI